MLIGKIVGIHGIKGTNKLRSYAESLSVFSPGRSILVRDLRGREASYEIDWVKPHTGTPLVSFKGIADRDQAKRLIGAELFIPQSELPELDEDTYYWYDLIGIEVYTRSNEFLGRIESIMDNLKEGVLVTNSAGKVILVSYHV